MGTQQITLKSMRFHASIGILPHERAAAQPVEVDLTVDLADGDEFVDYRRLYDAASRVFASGHIDYLEEIGERIAAAALACGARIRRAHVAVRKPHVALGGPLAYAEVVVERRADA
jgi:dihydroneopterin aldolase